MTKFARNLTAAIIAIFIVVMMVLLASSTLREDNPLEGNLSSTLSKTCLLYTSPSPRDS